MKKSIPAAWFAAVLWCSLLLLLGACQPVQRLETGQAASAAGAQSSGRSSEEAANQAVVQRFYDEVFTQKKMPVLDEVFAPDLVIHDLDVGGELPGGGLPETLAAFPDVKATVDQMVVEGDLVAASVTYTGTHQAEFLGVPPTGKTVTWSIIDLWRVKDGKIVELWHNIPNDDILEQIQPQAGTGTAAPTGAAAPGTAPGAAAGSAPMADTNPAKPDDVTQGRLRVSNCVYDGFSVDWLLDGKLTVNGGVPQENLGALDVSGYQYLAPGTYKVAVVPAGEGIDKALLGPLDVTIAAGHRYTLAMLGQVGEQHSPLLIDETEVYQKAGISPEMVGNIVINNVQNSTGVSFIQDGAGEKDVPYGGYAAAALPSGAFQDFKVIVSGAGEPGGENIGAGHNIPGVDFLDCFAGIYPSSFDTHTAAETSALNPIDFLAVRSDGFGQVGHPEWGFTTFLAALKTAGLGEEVAQGGPYLIFAPTNAAFAALPQDKRDALLADPQALVNLIHTHLVEGYFPYGTLGPLHQGFNRTVTNMRGQQLKMAGNDENLTINGRLIGGTTGTFVANGTRVMSVPMLLPDGE